MAVVDLGHNADVDRVQEVLDAIPLRGRRRRRRAGSSPVTSPDELILRGAPDQVAKLVDRLQASTLSTWRRRRDLEKRLHDMRAAGTGTFCFSKEIETIHNCEFTVWLQTRGATELYVSSIVPSDRRSELGYAEYNQVLSDFKHTLISPLVNDLRIHVIQVPVSLGLDLENSLTVQASRSLRAFSNSANKSLLHHLDLKRWNAFVIQTHKDRTVIDPQLLDDWLANDGWPDQLRARLVSEYDAARSLLTTYDDVLPAND